MEQIRLKLDSQEDDVLFLSNYFQSKDFRKLFKVIASYLFPGLFFINVHLSEMVWSPMK